MCEFSHPGKKRWGLEGLHLFLVLQEDRRRIFLIQQKVNKGREMADLGICKSFILAGAQSTLDPSLARMSFGSVILIQKTESKLN